MTTTVQASRKLHLLPVRYL